MLALELVFGTRITEAEVLEAVVLARGCNGSAGALMKRIYFDCVEGFAKAKMDGGGFFLRLKTATEHLSCLKFLERGF